MSSPEKKDPEPSTPKSEGSFEGGRNAGPPPLPQGPTAHTFGGGALFGALNQQASASSGGGLSSAAPTGGLGESTFSFGGGNAGTTLGNTGTKSGFGTSGTAFGFGSSGGTTFGSVSGTAGSGVSLFGSTSAAAQSSTGGGGVFGGTGGGFGQSAGAFGQPAAQPPWRGSAGGGAGGHRGPLPSGGGGGLFGESGPGPSDEDGDTNAVPFGQIRPFGSTRPQQPNQPRAPRTWFYLVCGGESVPEKERRSREQMNLIYDTIIKKGMATKEHIVFVYGRGQKLNNSVTRSFEATGYTFKLYGPQMQQGGGLFGGPAPQQKKCPLPGNEDNAVVIFIGQGKYSPITNDNGGGFAFNNSPTASADTFGELLFINTGSYATMYAATLKDLKAKNTLFISLADYSGEAFRRAFDETLKARNRKMFVVCLSDSLHSAKDYCLASAFSDFLDEEDWKNKTVEEFTQVIEEKYAYHAAVEEKSGEIVQYTEDDYNHQVKETGAWATGNFSNLVHKPIPSYDWAMFREVEELKETVDDANVGELSTHMKEKLDSFIDNMEQLRTEAIQVNLHLPRAFETVGDSDVCSMTWKDFLLLKD